MKIRHTIIYGVLAEILALTFTTCKEEDDTGTVGDLQKWTAAADSTFYLDYGESICAIAYGNDRFVAVGDRNKIAYCDW